MAMIIDNDFEFNDLSNVIDFVKPLLIEGYSVSINKTNKHFLYDGEEVFTVVVGKKGCKWSIYDPEEEKACAKE